MSTADLSEHTITRVPTVADVVGPDLLMDELSWEVRGKLLRAALDRTHRAMQLWSVDDEPAEPAPAGDPEPSIYDDDPDQEAWEDEDPYP